MNRLTIHLYDHRNKTDALGTMDRNCWTRKSKFMSVKLWSICTCLANIKCIQCDLNCLWEDWTQLPCFGYGLE